MFEKYDAYKDSGVEWIGNIPAKWSLKKISHIFRNIGSGTTPLSGSDIYYKNGYINWLQTGDLNDGYIDETSKKITEKALRHYSTLKQYPKGSLVVAMYGATIGKVGILNIDTATNQACCVLGANLGVNIKYYFYMFQGFKADIIRMAYGGGQPNISQDTIKKLRLPFPDLSTQHEISKFLDQKTTEIDQAIAIKEQQIALLNERKQIVIQKAVTQGLDLNVPMKDSGVEWIGQIPEHWEVKKIKYATKIFRGKFTHRPRNDPSLYDGKYPFFQTGDVAKAGKFLVDFKQTLNEKGLRVSTLIPKGTVVITIAANIGDVSILGIDACFPDSIVGFQPKELLDRDFLFYSLLSMKNQFVNSSIKNTQMNLNVDRIGSNYICVCPKDEQINIVEKIEEFNANFENAINLLNREIGKLKEYKATLIDSVVTGKVRVG